MSIRLTVFNEISCFLDYKERKILRNERTFAQKEAFEREGVTSKPTYGKEAQGGRFYNKNKKPPPQYPYSVGCSDRVSFGAASNYANFRKMNKGERRERCKKCNLCRSSLPRLTDPEGTKMSQNVYFSFVAI